MVLDGDTLRRGLNRDLGFRAHERSENIRRAAEVARLMNDAGLIVVAALISPLRTDRAHASSIIGAHRFLEIHVSTPLEVCEAADVKGLYRQPAEANSPCSPVSALPMKHRRRPGWRSTPCGRGCGPP
ncbi:MAG: hypothetical protein A3G82_02660 [Burkholderiales bacterium RIFCSPLOWO2_12_FULL_67_210]|nr:MAG: hypothetical protein A3G82_02660 [Burkholderiales bacterium RIFCSPLOWO2_12_FULL_67_210]